MARKTYDPIKIGIIGLGRAGWGMHYGELNRRGRRSKYDIVAGCDVLKKRRDMLAEACGCTTYKDYKELIADPDVELVDIATPSPLHVDMAKAALKAGKLVFLEKPIALDYRGAKEIADAAKKSTGKIWFRHNRRFEPAFNHVRDILDSGVLGRVFDIRLSRGGYQRRDDWQTLIRCGGGQLLNWGPHIVDHALQLIDAPVAEQYSVLDRIAAVGDAEDHLRILLRGDNGCLAQVRISGGCALPEPEYMVHGDKGSLRCDGGRIEMRYLDPAVKPTRRRAKSSTPPFGGFGSAEKLQWVERSIQVKPTPKVDCDHIWDALYDTIRHGKAFPVTTDQALAVMRVITDARKGSAFDRT